MRQLKITKSITNRESASLDKYLQEIGKEELITVEEEVELAQRIKKGDQEALEKLTKANLRFVVSVAKQYQNQGLSLPDLIKKSTLTEETCCDILAGKTIPGIDATASLSKALDTSMDYLVGNSEYSCAIASEDEQDIILRYRQLSKKGKRIFLGMMENMEEEKTE